MGAKFRWGFLSLLVFLHIQGRPCSVFKSPFQGDGRLSHNVDWFEQLPDVQGALFLNPARAKKVGELLGAPGTKAEWISKFRSLTFSIAGAEFPVSGFNEKGLTIAVLSLPESQYPPTTDPRPALGLAQFAQYNLDTSATIEEVIASEKVVRPYSSSFKMHYIACDASERCVVLQFIDGNLKAFSDSSLPFHVLTNSPYPESVAAAVGCTQSACSISDTSLWRFSQMVLKSKAMSPTLKFEDQALGILEHVAQIHGSPTRFQFIYDAKNMKMSLRKRGAIALAEVRVDFANVSCAKPRQYLPMSSLMNGDVSGQWQDLTEAKQTEMAGKMGLPDKIASLYGKYPFERVSCVP